MITAVLIVVVITAVVVIASLQIGNKLSLVDFTGTKFASLCK